MKKASYASFFAFLLFLQSGLAQSCAGGFIAANTVTANTMLFEDTSHPTVPNAVTDFINWDFGDGTTDSGRNIFHMFPGGSAYWVKHHVQYHETGNPFNICETFDSVFVNPSLTGSVTMQCYGPAGIRVQWLTGSTYAVSSWVCDCVPTLFEIGVDTAQAVTMSTAGPMTGMMFLTSSPFFTYTLPFPHDYNFALHVNYSGGLFGRERTVYEDSIPLTPTDCHASFFISKDTVGNNEWVINNYSTGGPGLTYTWDFGDGTTATGITPSHNYSSVGNYKVCLTVSDSSCSDTYCDSAFFNTNEPGAGIGSLRSVDMLSGIRIKNNSLSFDLYPNPARDIVYLRYDKELYEKLSVKIFDNTGREVYVPLSGTSSELGITVSNLNPGIYLVMMSDGKKTASRKFIRE